MFIKSENLPNQWQYCNWYKFNSFLINKLVHCNEQYIYIGLQNHNIRKVEQLDRIWCKWESDECDRLYNKDIFSQSNCKLQRRLKLNVACSSVLQYFSFNWNEYFLD